MTIQEGAIREEPKEPDGGSSAYGDGVTPTEESRRMDTNLDIINLILENFGSVEKFKAVWDGS